jgi:predicted  nucleic acid-binding Zn-ribbon protein
MVDRQLAGLKGRLSGSQRFLDEQSRQLGSLSDEHASVTAHIKKLDATIKNQEGEVAALDERIEGLRQKMNSANTNKEYKAFLTELNTHKANRDRLEEETIKLIEEADALKARLGEIEGKREERDKLRKVAETERDTRRSEVQGHIDELQAQRDEAAKDVPTDVLATYDKLLDEREEEAMASIEVQDRKRHEYTCGACMMAIPMESVSALLSHGNLTMCASCGAILYVSKETAEELQPARR